LKNIQLEKRSKNLKNRYYIKVISGDKVRTYRMTGDMEAINSEWIREMVSFTSITVQEKTC
jgi:predicted component of type VI protein secretion system